MQQHATTQLNGNSHKGLKIPRRATRRGVDPFSKVEWTTRKSVIKEKDGTVVFQVDNCEVPKAWSQLATDIIVSKYFRKAGVPQPDGHLGSETSARQVVNRLATSIRWWGEQHGYFDGPEDAQAFEDELKHLLINQEGAFNSPVWFNAGLSHVYGIIGSGGQWAWNEDSKRIEAVPNSYARPQCSACFIQSVEDNLVDSKGIFELLASEARLFKYGSGSGTNFSKIRSKYEKLSGGGTSSGLMSFLKVLDAGAGATKSGGTTRRAAKMNTLNIRHPEIEDFITWKSREEKKVAALIAQGYDSDFNGEAYQTVSGQNANNSVRVDDEFMAAAKADGTVELIRPTDNKVHKVVSAKALWDLIAKSAFECADPGTQYDTTINTWHTCKASGRINGSNPCSEYMFLDDSACNLASLNLMKFLRSDGTFDVEAYRHAIRIFFIAQEILVGFSSYPTQLIAQNSEDYRPLGLGYANLGTLQMVLGMPYDSPEGRALAGVLTAIMTGHAYTVSAEMAAVKGPFNGIHRKDGSGKTNWQHMAAVMEMHLAAANRLAKTGSPIESMGGCTPAQMARVQANLFEYAVRDWEQACALGALNGWRNAQATVIAPTGTIGLLMDCDTTGVEPDFSIVKYKKLAGGGMFKIINQSVPRALRNLGYTEAQVKDIEEYVVGRFKADGTVEVEGHETIEGAPHLKVEHYAVFDCANKADRGTRFIHHTGHLRMMAAAQPFISGAISKTINMPNEVTVDDVRDAYELGHTLGLKAVALYRDGSKLSQPLNSGDKKAVAVESLSADDLIRGAETLAPVDLVRLKTAVDKLTPGLGRGEVEQPPLDNDRGIKRTVTVFSSYGAEKVDIQVWEYPDGRPAEIYVGARKSGTMVDNFLKEVGRNYSRMLQLGASLDDLTKKLLNEHGPLAGQTDHKYLKSCLGIQDLLAKILRYEYFGETNFLNVKPDPEAIDYLPPRRDVLRAIQGMRIPRAEKTLDAFVAAPSIDQVLGKKGDDANDFLAGLGGDAPECDQCGHITVRNGACYKCLNCGNSLGCS